MKMCFCGWTRSELKRTPLCFWGVVGMETYSICSCKTSEMILPSIHMVIQNCSLETYPVSMGMEVSVYLSACGRWLPDDTEHMEPKILWQEAGTSDLNISPSVELLPWFMLSRKLRESGKKKGIQNEATTILLCLVSKKKKKKKIRGFDVVPETSPQNHC